MNGSFFIAEDYQYIAWAIDLGQSLMFYDSFILFPIGIILNIIEILIFRLQTFTKTTMGFYFSINCVLNISILTFLLIIAILIIFLNMNLMFYSTISCILYFVIMLIIYQSISWLNVIICADRLLFVLYPNKFKFAKNKQILCLILLVMFVMIILVNVPSFFFQLYEIKSNSSISNTTVVTQFCTASFEISTARETLAILWRIIIPFILMFVMNIFLIVKVKESKKKFSKNNNQEFRFVFTVIVSTLIFLIILIPNLVLAVYSNYYRVNTSMPQRQTFSAFLFLLEITTANVYLVRYSFDIIFQIIFNSVFRNHVFRIIANLFGLSKVRIESSSGGRSNKTNKTKSTK
ncbi:unnamed protein product [Brachionus calyciflorus]|uniref:G-protein coupled receptors family 1 profile domain-containing protein n=1 Tax=Brachionus calyciflorus TaxID=104777 RepID=A0A814JNX7_9BILA|nr:unnamed protein product [Brachionus calyciflorus]